MSVKSIMPEAVADAANKEHESASTCVDAAEWLNAPDEPDTPLVRELIEIGEMVAVVGQPKAGKSFIALQLAVCIALGIPFLGRETVRQKVYVANLEVSRKQYKKRLRKACAAMGVSPESLRGWLFIDNMKGVDAKWEWCRSEAKRHGCTVALIDPFYHIFNGDESDALACADAISEMKKYQKDKLTLIVVFHSPKGFAADRQLIDMISGSSILARFPESIFGLLNHAAQKTYRVVKCVLRNYAPPDDQTIVFRDGMFVPDDSVAPIVEDGHTRWNKARQEKANTELSPLVREVLIEHGMQQRKDTLKQMVQEECLRRNGFTPGDKKVAAVITAMVDHHELVEANRQNVRGGPKPIGLPEQMTRFINPKFDLSESDKKDVSK